tara:strand:- start:310 stop:453 length:144 start_codon:yes stop_codon:yes gene_type:complete
LLLIIKKNPINKIKINKIVFVSISKGTKKFKKMAINARKKEPKKIDL